MQTRVNKFDQADFCAEKESGLDMVIFRRCNKLQTVSNTKGTDFE